MVATAFVAIDLSGVILIPPGTFAGGMLLVLALQAGLFLWSGSTGRCRWFWAGFEAAGLAALIAYHEIHRIFDEAVVRWPVLVFEFYTGPMRGLHPASLHWDMMHLPIIDQDGDPAVLWTILAFEVSYAPVFLVVATAVGLVASTLPGLGRLIRPSPNPSRVPANIA